MDGGFRPNSPIKQKELENSLITCIIENINSSYLSKITQKVKQKVFLVPTFKVKLNFAKESVKYIPKNKSRTSTMVS